MKYLPLMHNFSGKRCLIVGGGKVALRRARRVLSAGGIIDVVAPQCNDELNILVDQCGGTVLDKHYKSADIAKNNQWEYALVVAATDDRAVNQKITDDCKLKNILVNVADDAGSCDVVFPTVVDRDPAMITISSGSASPEFSMLLRDRINTFIPNGYGKLAELFGKYRNQVRQRISNPKHRRAFWNKVVHGFIAEGALSGNKDHAEAQLNLAMDDHQNFMMQGEVYLIGAGPGDPDLLTLRAFRLLQQAEVVIYDRLVSPQILDRLSDDKEMIYVGKQRANHSTPQQDINELLVHHASLGKRVARLKGGDPFIFGRGGEEIENLAAQKIPFQVIPGITAANGCASYSGIPLTHRDHAQSVRFVTGQLQNGTVNLDWENLVAPDQTLVFYMGLQGLPIICEKLVEHGCPGTTQAAVIEKGTTLDQKIYVSTLNELPDVIASNDVQAPTLTIVGSVVSLHSTLRWFHPKKS